MKRKIIPLILIISMIILFGCQYMPEKEVIINKGDGKLEEVIQSTPVPTEQAIDIDPWKETYSIPNLVCNINTEITVPETGVFPVYKVKQRSFEDKFADRIVKYFTADATGVRVTSPTKEELEQQLVQVKRGTYNEDDSGGRWEPYEGQEEDIKSLEEKIASTAPETFDPVSNNTIALPVGNTYRMPNGLRLYIEAESQSISIYSEKYGITQPESWLKNGSAIPGEPPGSTIDNIKISEETAVGKVNELISDLGITNFGISAIEKARIVNNYSIEIVSEGWQITLTRNDGNSIPVYLLLNQLSGLLSFGEEDFIERWWPEIISVYIDESGIRSFSWRFPIEITEILNKNVALMSFEDIEDIIKNNIKFGYSRSVLDGWVKGENHVNVNKIILANMLVPIKDDLEHQILSPAWLVYYDTPEMPEFTFVFAVNAIDGSSIDLSMRRHRPES